MAVQDIIVMLSMYIVLYSILVYLIYNQRDNKVIELTSSQDICWYSGLPSTSSYQDMDE